MRKIRKRCQGFFLVDAIGASALILGALYLQQGQQKHINNESLVLDIAGSVADVLMAVDRRVYIDGYHHDRWDMSADNATEFRELLLQELVAEGNSECGDDSRWVPLINAHRSVALVPCDVFSYAVSPLELSHRTIDVSSVVSEQGDRRIKEWRMEIGFETESSFDGNWGYLPNIVESILFATPTRLTGRFESYLGLKDQDGRVSMSECRSAKDECVVIARYVPSELSALYTENLPVDGTVFIRDTLRFESDAGVAECVRYGQTVGCGVDIEGDDLVMSLASMATEHYWATSGSSTATQSLCYDPEIHERVPCGVTGSNPNESVLSALYTNVLEAYKELRVYDSSDALLFGYDENAQVLSLNSHLNLEGYNGELSHLNVTTGGLETRILDARDVNGNDFYAAGDLEYQALTGDAIRYIQNDSFSTSGSCQEGSVALRHDDTLVVCRGGRWDEPMYPSGMVLPFGQNTCPAGWVVFDSDREGFRIEGSHSEGAYIARNRTVTLGESHLPEHRHEYDQPSDIHSARSGSRSRKRGRMDADATTETAGGESGNLGRAAIFTPETYAVEFCRKL